MKFKVGHPWSYDKDKHLKKFVDGVRDTLSIGQGAELAGIPASTAKDWVKRGCLDRKEGNDTELAQLSAQIRNAQAEKAKELIKEGMEGGRNWKFIQWLLERCFKDDYGIESEEHKELLEIVKRLCEDMSKLKATQGIVIKDK